jgi:hypothetical protein
MSSDQIANQNVCIQEEELPDHHFRTEIPNCVIKSNLGYAALGVYTHLKCIAGDSSSCWKSMSTLSEELGMGLTKLREILKDLENGTNSLNLKLIKIFPTKKQDGSPGTNIIKIINVWGFNGIFNKDKNINKDDSQSEPVPSLIEGTTLAIRGYDPRHSSTKKNPINNNPINKNPTTTTKPPTSKVEPSNPLLDGGGGGGFENSFGDLFYKNTAGESCKISQSDIYKHFIKTPFETAIIHEAIEQARKSTDLIGSITKYLEAICLRLSNQKNVKAEKKSEPAKKPECHIPNTSHVPKMTLGEWALKNDLTLAKDLGLV